MRKGRRYIAACAVALLLAGALLHAVNVKKPETGIILAQWEQFSVVTGARFAPVAEVTYARDELLTGLLVYVSPDTPLPPDMPAPNTRAMTKMLGDYVRAEDCVSLNEEAIYALCALATEYPLHDSRIAWGARSPMQQAALNRETFLTYCAVMPVSEALARADRDVPASGLCEHQTAYAFDLALSGALNLGESDVLARTQEGRAWRDNAWQYGFIRRYPPGKSDITGIENEQMHFRYVGKTNALIMRAADWCLEEYLDALHAHGAITLMENETPRAYVLCARGEDMACFAVPEHQRLSASADNLGYSILVITILE